MMSKTAIFIAIVALVLTACIKIKNEPDTPAPSFEEHKDLATKSVIIIVIDGARYSETWGDSTQQYIPFLARFLAHYGVVCTQFYNQGVTNTLSGHTAICTGNYQEISNDGTQIPQYPSIFQYYNAKYRGDSMQTAIITSKDKLAVLGNCQQIEWANTYLPYSICGLTGLGSGYCADSLTFSRSITNLTTYHPRLLLINFKDPDYFAHQNDWSRYLQSISACDKYVYQIWQFIQSNSAYSNQTSLFVTNDHGRHLDGIGNGFVSHGDSCLGCRHLMFFAYGPDFKKGLSINKSYQLTDIAPTVAYLLRFTPQFCNNNIMYDLFK